MFSHPRWARAVLLGWAIFLVLITSLALQVTSFSDALFRTLVLLAVAVTTVVGGVVAWRSELVALPMFAAVGSGAVLAAYAAVAFFTSWNAGWQYSLPLAIFWMMVTSLTVIPGVVATLAAGAGIGALARELPHCHHLRRLCTGSDRFR